MSESVRWPATLPLVRLAGGRAEMLSHLSHPQSIATAEWLVTADDRLAADAHTIGDRLHEIVGGLDRSGPRYAKPSLVGLRRSLHAGRLPSRREWSPQVEAVLPEDLRVEIRRWIELRHRSGSVRHALPELLAAEGRLAQRALRRQVAGPAFRRGLWHASPVLSRELDRWLENSSRQPRRQVLFRLAKYLARAATKTSPFSTFTEVGFARWQRGGGALTIPGHAVGSGVGQLYDVTRNDVLAALAGDPRLWRSLSLTVNPSATRDGGTVRFLGRPPQEPLITIELIPALKTCLDIVSGSATCLVGEAEDLLTAAGGGGEPYVRQARSLLQQLVKAGLLDARLPYTGERVDLGDLAAWLRERDLGFGRTADLLEGMQACLRESAATADFDAHRHQQRRLRRLIDEAAAELDITNTLMLLWFVKWLAQDLLAA